jgi:hypothetical protein
MTAAKAAVPAETTAPTIVERMIAVMEDVGAIRKDQKNEQQHFVFRGIDAVINAVSPAFRKHGIIVVPQVLKYEYGTVEVGGKRTPMAHVRVTVNYTFHAVDGQTIESVTVGEAMDSGDKATAKAMSVALRTALLQSLALPTDDIDPDDQVYERSDAPTEEQVATAREWIGSLDAYDDDGLRAVWRDHADLLDVEVDGTSLREAIMARKALLDAEAATVREAEAAAEAAEGAQ